jgi:hypothetical protein
MRRRRVFLMILPWVIVILFGGVKPSSSKDPIRQFTMDNGLKGILEESKTAPVVALQIWVKVGGADENDEEAEELRGLIIIRNILRRYKR